MGRLDDAAASFRAARRFDPKLPSANLDALQEHFEHKAAENHKDAAIEVDFVLDLSQPLGLKLSQAGLITTIDPGGQCEAAGVKRGDRVVAAGMQHVAARSDFKAAVAAHRKDGFEKLVLTVNRPSEGGESAEPAKKMKEKHDATSVHAQGPSAVAEKEVLWNRENGTLPAWPGTIIYKPEMISEISRYRVDHKSNPNGDCAYQSFVVIYDLNGELLVSVIDDFFSEPVMARLVSTAFDATWEWAHIHPDKTDPSNLRKGNGFPGLRVDAHRTTSSLVARCLKPALAVTDPSFDLDRTKDVQTL